MAEEKAATEVKKKRPIKRLKTMYPLRALVDGMYERAVEAGKEGKPVAWCMVNWWGGDVVLRAMDVACIYPEQSWHAAKSIRYV